MIGIERKLFPFYIFHSYHSRVLTQFCGVLIVLFFQVEGVKTGPIDARYLFSSRKVGLGDLFRVKRCAFWRKDWNHRRVHVVFQGLCSFFTRTQSRIYRTFRCRVVLGSSGLRQLASPRRRWRQVTTPLAAICSFSCHFFLPAELKSAAFSSSTQCYLVQMVLI